MLFGIFDITKRVVQESNTRGMIVSVGLTKHKGYYEFLCEATRWDEELANQIKQTYKEHKLTEYNSEVIYIDDNGSRFEKQ